MNDFCYPMDPGFYNMDCMEGMKAFPDKFFDLAIVDPPYGGGFVSGDENTPLKNFRWRSGRLAA